MTSSLDMIRGRSNVLPLTNKSGGPLVAGDVCVLDTANDESVVTTTSAASMLKVYIAAESIASNATGKFYSAGFCPLVTPNASVTNGRYLFTHTVAKQAAENATYGAGAFGVILKSGTTPSVWLFGTTAQGSGGGVARSGATTDGHLAIWNGSSADSIKDGGTVPAGAGADGWSAASGTWTYSSADAPTFVISVNADMTTTIGVGQRIKLTQTTEKFFIVTAVGAFGGGATLITVYGGTDYTLANAAITSPYYSVVKAPFGFPMTPAKWTQSTTDTTQRHQTNPASGTWYNLGTLSLVVPIGVWVVYYAAGLQGQRAAAGALGMKSTLSTGNNSETDKAWTDWSYAANDDVAAFFHTRTNLLSLAAKATYYLNEQMNTSSAQEIYLRSDEETTIISALCAYL